MSSSKLQDVQNSRYWDDVMIKSLLWEMWKYLLMKVKLYVDPLGQDETKLKVKKYRGNLTLFLDSIQKVCEDLFGKLTYDYESFTKGLILYW